MDPFEAFKEKQKQAWSSFPPFELVTAQAAPRLVRFARIASGGRVLDVGCGTGVVAITAAREGARVTGLDLTPALIERAHDNARIAEVEVDWHVGDAEALPFPDATFDVVVSQFGHMFAPRPEVAVSEMLRVLTPGGTIAFATWPPELFIGKMFGLLARYAPPPPPGAAVPAHWGDVKTVRERLGSGVEDLAFDHDIVRFPTLSPQHYRTFMEHNLGMLTNLVAALASDPPRLATLRRELDDAIAHYFEANMVRQDYLLSRALKARSARSS